jgi:hypothetical protein
LLDALGQALPGIAGGEMLPGAPPAPASPNQPTGHGDQYTRTTPDGESVMKRERPEPDERRKRLVTAFTDMVKQAKSHWETTFRKMEEDQKFVTGQQWPEDPKKLVYNDVLNDDLYVANITLQHVQKRTAALYAKNPKAAAKKRPRLLATVWDGTLESLAQAEATVQQAKAALMGMPAGMPAPPAGGGGPGGATASLPPEPPGPPGAPPTAPGGTLSLNSPGQPGAARPWATSTMMPAGAMPDPGEMLNAQAVLADAQSVKQQIAQLNKIGKTLEMLYEYEIGEQQQSFKSMMKMTVRRATTCGVSWTLGFQRIIGPSPDRDSAYPTCSSSLTWCSACQPTSPTTGRRSTATRPKK